jgi:hypothetical protein
MLQRFVGPRQNDHPAMGTRTHNRSFSPPLLFFRLDDIVTTGYGRYQWMITWTHGTAKSPGATIGLKVNVILLDKTSTLSTSKYFFRSKKYILWKICAFRNKIYVCVMIVLGSTHAYTLFRNKIKAVTRHTSYRPTLIPATTATTPLVLHVLLLVVAVATAES